MHTLAALSTPPKRFVMDPCARAAPAAPTPRHLYTSEWLDVETKAPDFAERCDGFEHELDLYMCALVGGKQPRDGPPDDVGGAAQVADDGSFRV